MEQGLCLFCLIAASQSNFAGEGSQTISYKDIAAVVEKTTIDDFQEEAFKLKVEKDPKWLEEKVMHHNNIISRLAEKTAVVPIKFGTIFKTAKSLEAMLEKNYQGFLEIILNLDGKEEWGVKVYCDANKLKEELARSNQHIKDIDLAIKDKSEGAAYFLKRKRASLIFEESEKKMNEDAAAIHEELVKFADKNCLNKLQPKELTIKEAETILNGAYLIPKKKVSEFKSRVSDLQKTYAASGLELEISGPWPAYSFASLEGK
ncbi:MAG: GvpL/GvpF family gas vesicle protein [Candidatus Margulisiibacteriota bacterium]